MFISAQVYDRQELRRRLSLDADPYEESDHRSARTREINLRAKLEERMNFQICFMNENLSDDHSEKLENGDQKSSDPLGVPEKGPSNGNKGMVSRKSSVSSSSFSLLPKINFMNPMLMFPNIPGLTKNRMANPHLDILEFDSFCDYHKHLHQEVKKALKQAKEMAKMQMQLETGQGKSSKACKILGFETKPQVMKHEPDVIKKMSRSSLKILMDQLIKRTTELNGLLVKLLEERDEHLMSQVFNLKHD